MTTGLDAQIHRYLTAAPGSHFAQQEVTMVEHWQGDANLLWRVHVGGQDVPGEDAVVKLFLDAGQARSRRQYEAHQFFAPFGIAPQPLWADRYPHGLSRQLIVYQWIEGESIATSDFAALAAWAETIAMVHNTSMEEVRRFSPHPLNLATFWRVERGSISQIERWLAPSHLRLSDFFASLATAGEQLVQAGLPLWAHAVPSAVHGDLAYGHTLLERGRVVLLDWEMFGLGDPALDVARLLHRQAQPLEDDQMALWLDHYLQSVDQVAMGERIDLYRRLLPFHDVIYLLLGLQQHTSGHLSSELRAALPFLESALAAALKHSAASLLQSDAGDMQATAGEVVNWLTRTSSSLS
jgi:thiamine kinase-like enzyme